MICYREGVSEIEIKVINEYWEVAQGTTDNFLHTSKGIYNRYKKFRIRLVPEILKGSYFSLNSTNFKCGTCGSTIPVKNRTEYKSRIKLSHQLTCSDCVRTMTFQKLEESLVLVDKYIIEHFSPTEYIETLTLVELFALLSFMIEKPFNYKNPSDPANNIKISGIESIDSQLLSSLFRKGALIDVRSMPHEVISASNFIAEIFSETKYGRYPNLSGNDLRGRIINPRVYFRKPIKDQVVVHADIINVLSRTILDREISDKDVSEVKHIISEMQIDKLQKSVSEIRKDYQICIENSGYLSSILYYFSINHSPSGTYLSMQSIARKVVVMIHKKSVSSNAEPHVFAKLLGDYAKKLDEQKWSLDFKRALPATCKTSPFESMFSSTYCGQLNWDTISTREIIKLWLDHIERERS